MAMDENEQVRRVFAQPGHLTCWQRRCRLCQLANTNREAYDFVTQALLSTRLDLTTTAAELRSRYGVKVLQNQLSVHRRRHLLPDLQAAEQTWLLLRAVLAQYGDLPPLELARKAAQATLVMALAKQTDGSLESDEAARNGTLISRLTENLARLELAETQLAAAREAHQSTQAEFQEQFVRFIQDNYPELVPLLAAGPGAASKEVGHGPAA
jgi:hypothetical protein